MVKIDKFIVGWSLISGLSGSISPDFPIREDLDDLLYMKDPFHLKGSPLPN